MTEKVQTGSPAAAEKCKQHDDLLVAIMPLIMGQLREPGGTFASVIVTLASVLAWGAYMLAKFASAEAVLDAIHEIAKERLADIKESDAAGKRQPAKTIENKELFRKRELDGAGG